MKSPRGEKRPSDAIGCAVTENRIAAGEIEDIILSCRRNSELAGSKACNYSQCQKFVI